MRYQYWIKLLFASCDRDIIIHSVSHDHICRQWVPLNLKIVQFDSTHALMKLCTRENGQKKSMTVAGSEKSGFFNLICDQNSLPCTSQATCRTCLDGFVRVGFSSHSTACNFWYLSSREGTSSLNEHQGWFVCHIDCHDPQSVHTSG